MEKDELNKILDNHKLWLKTNGEEGECADLKGADLEYANLEYADLKDADLEYADLEYAELQGANLKGADLQDAELQDANLEYADLQGADLKGANLKGADLKGADLKDADLDYSSGLPMWCGGLDVHIDDKQAIQLLYHLVRNVRYSKNTSTEMKKICQLKSIIKKANEFHRVNECGKIEE